MAFIPAATDLQPSEKIALVRIVAHVVPADFENFEGNAVRPRSVSYRPQIRTAGQP